MSNKFLMIDLDAGLRTDVTGSYRQGRHGPVDWAALYNDEARLLNGPEALESAGEALNLLEEMGWQILIVSERPERYRLGLHFWLKQAGLLSRERLLILRPTNDVERTDARWKASLLESGEYFSSSGDQGEAELEMVFIDSDHVFAREMNSRKMNVRIFPSAAEALRVFTLQRESHPLTTR